jgi:hypothetical protein
MREEIKTSLNCHDNLLEACREAQEAYKLKDDALTFQLTMDGVMDSIDKAINQAEGK